VYLGTESFIRRHIFGTNMRACINRRHAEGSERPRYAFEYKFARCDANDVAQALSLFLYLTRSCLFHLASSCRTQACAPACPSHQQIRRCSRSQHGGVSNQNDRLAGNKVGTVRNTESSKNMPGPLLQHPQIPEWQAEPTTYLDHIWGYLRS
jgi:hypothetical protein